MNKICTTIEQSKKLIDLGINVNTADMYYHKCYGIDGGTYNLSIPSNSGFKNKHFFDDCPDEIPAWSLSALLSLIKPVNENTYTIQGTLDGGAIISFEEVTSVAFQEDNILDAAFEMVCYLLENKLI